MGFFDSVSDFFGFSSGPSVPSNPQPAPSYNPAMRLSDSYSLADLTGTNQSLAQPNIPSAAYMIDNLKTSAQVLEYLASRVGPFQVISSFRTKELQDILAAQGEPTAKGLSFHEVGRGFDIYPTTMNIQDFMGLILAQEDVQSQFAEIAIKPSQNSIHLATNVPGDIRTPKITNLDESGNYVQMTADQIARYVEPFVESMDDAYYAAAQLVTLNRAPMLIAAGVALAGGAYLIFSSKKSQVRSNPTRSNKRVSGKIRKLRKEEIPQKQAVAMALSMEREKRLGPRGGYKRNPRKREKSITIAEIKTSIDKFSKSNLRHYIKQLSFIIEKGMYKDRRDLARTKILYNYAVKKLALNKF